MSASAMILEQDLEQASVRAKTLAKQSEQKRRQADQFVASLRRSGKRLTDPENMAAIDQAYIAADRLKQQAAEQRGAVAALARHTGLTQTDSNGRDFVVGGGIVKALQARHPEKLSEWVLRGSEPIGDLLGVDVLSRENLIARIRGGSNLLAVSGDLTGGIALDQQLFPPVEILRRTPRLFDYVTTAATNTESVVYAQQTTRTSAAAETALGTAYGEADFVFTRVTAPVESIGHFTTMYREQAADTEQFQAVVTQELSDDVYLRLESEIYAGNGAADNLTGVLNTPNIANVRRNYTSGERIIELIHRGITQVRLAFREPTAVLLHPSDYESMLFEKTGSDNLGNYVFLGALSNLAGDTPASVWGLPIITSTVATQGTGMVACWKDATLWIRSGLQVRVSDSHDDYFTKRQLAVLAECRAAFSVKRPNAFCELTNLADVS